MVVSKSATEGRRRCPHWPLFLAFPLQKVDNLQALFELAESKRTENLNKKIQIKLKLLHCLWHLMAKEMILNRSNDISDYPKTSVSYFIGLSALIR